MKKKKNAFGYGYVPLRFGEGNVVRRMGTQQQLKKRIGDTDVVGDVTYTRQCVITCTRVVI